MRSVVVVAGGDLDAPRLWLLRRLLSSPYAVHVIRAGVSGAPSDGRDGRDDGRALAGSSRRGHPPATRVGMVLAARELRRQAAHVDRLFDGEELRAWWQTAPLGPVDVAAASGPDLAAGVAARRPDVIVSLDGAFWDAGEAAAGVRAALTVYGPFRPLAVALTRVIRAIGDGEPARAGAYVTAREAGDGVTRSVWWGRPHASPGDSAAVLLFKTQVETADALAALLATYAAGAVPGEARGQLPAAGDDQQLDLVGWLRYVAGGRDRRAHALCARALRP